MTEVNVCRVCLANNKDKMCRLKSVRCRRFYEKLVNSQLDDGLPETFCYICYALLRKSTRFSNMAQQSQLILTKLKDCGTQINEETLSKLNRPKYTYSVTKAELVSIESEIQPMYTFPDPDICIKKENSDLEEDILKNDIGENYYDWNQNSNDRNSNINDGNDENYNNSDIKTIDGENFKPFTKQTCAVWIAKGRNNKNNDRNDNNDDTNDKIRNTNDNNEVNIFSEQPCTIWSEAGHVSVETPEMDEEETFKNQDKSRIKYYYNKKKTNKTTKNNVDAISDGTQQHTVEDPLKTKLSLLQNDISKYIIKLPSDDDIPKNDKQVKTLSHTGSARRFHPRRYRSRGNTGIKSYNNKYQDTLHTRLLNFMIDKATVSKLSRPKGKYSGPNKRKFTCIKSKNRSKDPDPDIHVTEESIDMEEHSIGGYVPANTAEIFLEENIHDQDRTKIKCYQNKKKIPKNNINGNSDVSQQHRVEDSLNTDTILSLPQVDISENDKSNEIIPPPSNNDISINDKPVKSLSHIQQMLWKQVTSLFDKKTLLTLGQAMKPSSSPEKETEIDNQEDSYSFIHMKLTKNKYFYCSVCNYRCPTRQILAKHVKACKRKYKKMMNSGISDPFRIGYDCELCQFKTLSQTEFELHKDKHKEELLPIDDREGEIFYCNNCNFKTDSKTECMLHENGHYMLHKCNLCDFKCDTEIELIMHKRTSQHTLKRFICDKCQKCFKLRSGIIRHFKHSGCLCSKCGLKFCDLISLKKHTVNVHNGLPISCKSCEFKCNTEKELSLHIIKNHNSLLLKCKLCDFKCESEVGMNRHIWYRHERIYNCYICDFQSTNKKIMQEHILFQHNVDKLYGCKICNFKTDEKKGLKTHVKRHTDEGFICDICNYKYKTKSYLTSHIQAKHTKSNTKFLCHYCGKLYKTKYQLRHHFLCHTMKMKYCRVCDFKTVYETKLKYHMSKHTGKKPFECDDCGETFMKGNDLKLHKLEMCRKLPSCQGERSKS